MTISIQDLRFVADFLNQVHSANNLDRTEFKWNAETRPTYHFPRYQLYYTHPSDNYSFPGTRGAEREKARSFNIYEQWSKEAEDAGFSNIIIEKFKQPLKRYEHSRYICFYFDENEAFLTDLLILAKKKYIKDHLNSFQWEERENGTILVTTQLFDRNEAEKHLVSIQKKENPVNHNACYVRESGQLRTKYRVVISLNHYKVFPELKKSQDTTNVIEAPTGVCSPFIYPQGINISSHKRSADTAFSNTQELGDLTVETVNNNSAHPSKKIIPTTFLAINF